jgi:hypothetical protein
VASVSLTKDNERICSICGGLFPATLEYFHQDRRNSIGLRGDCKTCRTLITKADYEKSKDKIKLWREKNKEHLALKRKENYIKNRDGSIKNTILLKKYGIYLDDCKEMFEKQNGVCAICGQPETRIQRGKLADLSVDHDHITGEVRGLLCNKCNIGIAHFYDNSDLLLLAFNYLEKIVV